jgi:hypothetical protein
MKLKLMIHHLVDLVGHISELSNQGDIPTKEVNFPASLCDLCLHTGNDPWILLDTFRRSIKEQRKSKR